jgi:hypothetical protein
MMVIINDNIRTLNDEIYFFFTGKTKSYDKMALIESVQQ